MMDGLGRTAMAAVGGVALLGALLVLAFDLSGDASWSESLLGGASETVRVWLQPLVSVAIIGLFAVPFQVLFPAVKRRPKILTAEFWVDLWYWHMGLVLQAIGFFAVVPILLRAVYRSPEPLLDLSVVPFWVEVALGVWLYDFIVYWRHRLEHTSDFLWAFHSVHHTTHAVDYLTTSRLHPFEPLLGTVLNFAAVKVGFSDPARSLAFAIYLNYNYFIHTNVRLRFPGPLKYIFVSPFMHYWHHARGKGAKHGVNVGVVFAWNDWLFGTFHHPADWPEAYGIDFDDPREQVGQNPIVHLIYPFKVLALRLAVLARSLVARPPAQPDPSSAGERSPAARVSTQKPR